MRYPGENGAVGMGIALGAGVVAAVLIYLIAQTPHRSTPNQAGRAQG